MGIQLDPIGVERIRVQWHLVVAMILIVLLACAAAVATGPRERMNASAEDAESSALINKVQLPAPNVLATNESKPAGADAQVID